MKLEPATDIDVCPAPVVLWVCVTCRLSLLPGVAPPLATDGRELFGLIGLLHEAHPQARRVVLRPVECMNGCERACTVAMGGPGKVSYLFGDLEPTEAHAAAVLDCALQFSQRPGGTFGRVERPALMRNSVLARIPPLPSPEFGASAA